MSPLSFSSLPYLPMVGIIMMSIMKPKPCVRSWSLAYTSALLSLTMISLSLCLTNNGSDVIIISDDWKGMLHRLRGMDVPRILHVLRFVLELVHAYTKIQ